MFTPRGLYAALGTTTGSVQVWDAASRRRVRSWPNTDWMSVSALAWRPCSRLFAIGRADGRLALLDVRAPDEVHKFRGHRGEIYGMQWSHNERFLVSADAHGTIHLWDARNMSARVGKMKHDSPVKVCLIPTIRSTADNLPTLATVNRPLHGARGNLIYWPQEGHTLTGVFTSGVLPYSLIQPRRRQSRPSRRTVVCTPCCGRLTRGSCSARTALHGTPASVCRTYPSLPPHHTPIPSVCTRSPQAAALSASQHTRAPSVRAVLVLMEPWSLRFAIVKRR
jgi:WD40 repeat protein